MPRFASVRMKTGTDIQNCAKRIGRRLGKTWRNSKRKPPAPEARARSTKSDCARERASAHTTRAAAAHPRQPKSAKVIITEVIGETFRSEERRVGKECRS